MVPSILIPVKNISPYLTVLLCLDFRNETSSREIIVSRNVTSTFYRTQVKAQLAEKAVEAAKAAENVLTGKKVIVEELQEEVKEAQSVVQEESSSLEREQLNANAAVQAARQSQDQVIFLSLIKFLANK